MYSVNDTIAAVSSAAGSDAVRHIVRISGPRAFEILAHITKNAVQRYNPPRSIIQSELSIDDELSVEATVYNFFSPRSYTGDDLAELHICGPAVLIEEIVKRLFALGARPAEAGEFTARAYLNGKIDLVQAEAVAQIVAGSNEMQLNAAQKLLSGRLAKSIRDIQNRLLDLISRIEAGLDFAGEEIEFISTSEAIKQIEDAVVILRQLLEGSVSCEEIISLPAVGIVGTPNAGKSSLLNALLGQQRSIVSSTAATTRDVLTGVLKLPHCNCAIFDCAGLLPVATEKNILDELAQNAAMEAIHTAQAVIFCVDILKLSWDEDGEIFELIKAKHSSIIAAATKCDLSEKALAKKIAALERSFGLKFVASSSKTGEGIESLRTAIDKTLSRPAATATETADIMSLNQRHRQWLLQAINDLNRAKEELRSDNEEVAVMLLRNGYRAFRELSDEGLDDAVLSRIFSRFCIGK